MAARAPAESPTGSGASTTSSSVRRFGQLESPTPRSAIDFPGLYRRLDVTERLLEAEASVAPVERLEARVKAIAEARLEAPAEGLDVMLVRCGGRPLALPLADLDYALDASGVSPLPGMPRHVLGAVVARGHILPVLDLRVLLGLEGGGMADLTRVLVSRSAGAPFAVAVETLEAQVRLPLATLVPAGRPPYRCATADGLEVLDLDALQEPDEGAT